MRVGAPADVVGSLWRGLAVLRFLTLAHAVLINALQWQGFSGPVAGWTVVTVIAVWTLISTWAYDEPCRRIWPVLHLDLAIGVGALAASRFILGPELLAQGATIPAFWVISPVLAWAIFRGWSAGVIAACAVVAIDLGFRVDITSESMANAFLMLLAGGMVGYCSTLVQRAAADRAHAAELAAGTAERERLARVVHDGVLQVLAYVQRRGTEIGGETAELARAAAEQEAILRALVQERRERSGVDRLADAGRGGDTGRDERHARHGRHGRHGEPEPTADLAGLLGGLSEPGVSIAVPAHPVPLPAAEASEVLAAVGEVIGNARRHAPGSPVHLLLEVEPDAVVIGIRDGGPGITEHRLEEAAAEGRLGIQQSIIGRIDDLGGAAVLHTAQGGGTEWELRLPV